MEIMLLQLNEIYRLDFFRAEREPCTSEILIQTEGVQFNIIYSNSSSASSGMLPQ